MYNLTLCKHIIILVNNFAKVIIYDALHSIVYTWRHRYTLQSSYWQFISFQESYLLLSAHPKFQPAGDGGHYLEYASTNKWKGDTVKRYTRIKAYPGVGAERGKHPFIIFAWLRALALGFDTLMVVEVVLPAVLCLIRVGKSRIERRSLQFYLSLCHLVT